MVCSYKITSIVVAILTIVFATSNLYKLLQESDEDIKRFLCDHVKRDDHKDMLRRHRKYQVKSHSTIEKEESFADKMKHEMENKEKKNRYEEKIEKEDECRKGITTRQLKGFKLLTTVGMVSSVLSILSAILIFTTVGKDHEKNQQRRYLLIPYIAVHLAIVLVEVFAEIYSTHLAKKLALMPIVLLVLCLGVIACFTVLILMYYRYLARAIVDKNANEVFDYSIMKEEKDASEA